MNHRHIAMTAVITGGVLLLSACTGNRTVSGTPSASLSPTVATTDVPNSGAPKVENPLPAKVLDGSPCDSALTPQQLTDFIGETTRAAIPKTDALGTACDWGNPDTGAGFNIGYQTRSDQGLSLTYKNAKPDSARWVELDPVQSYPAVAYVAKGLNVAKKQDCVIVVGISDNLAYSISLTIGDNAVRQGKDACLLGRDVADAVMTNLKARA